MKRKSLLSIFSVIMPICLFSLGFSSFSVTGDSFSGEIKDNSFNFAGVHSFITLNKNDSHPLGFKTFTICQDGFIEDGQITDTGRLIYYIDINRQVAESTNYVLNNSIKLTFNLAEINGKFINEYFSHTLEINKNNVHNLTISNYYLFSDEITIELSTENVTNIEVGFTFTILDYTSFSQIYNSFSSAANNSEISHFDLKITAVNLG